MAAQTEDTVFSDAYAADVPELYFNGFANILSTVDIATVLQRNGRPVAVLNMAVPIAKAYANYLLELVAANDEAAGQSLGTDLDHAAQTGAIDE